MEWEPFVRINYAYSAGIAEVDRLVDEYRSGDDGGAGVREPRRPSPRSPEDTAALDE